MSWDQAISIVGAAAAILQTFLLIASIIYINRQFAILRACSYIERMNSQDTIRRRASVDRWLRAGENDAQRIASFEEDADLQADVLGFANLFQELGVAYMYHSVHKKTVEDNFDFLIPYYWNQLRFLIEHLRSQRNDSLYRKFEYMAVVLSQSERTPR
jgi:hypothetical protein